jgi:hypothetical protein
MIERGKNMSDLINENQNEQKEIENLEEKKSKKKDSLIEALETPKRLLPSLVNELLNLNIPVRLSSKGYLIGGFYGLGDNDNKGFALALENSNFEHLVLLDNKGHKHLIKSFEDLVKFNNFIWGVFFKQDEFKKPDALWFKYMLELGVLNITPGSFK